MPSIESSIVLIDQYYGNNHQFFVKCVGDCGFIEHVQVVQIKLELYSYKIQFLNVVWLYRASRIQTFYAPSWASIVSMVSQPDRFLAHSGPWETIVMLASLCLVARLLIVFIWLYSSPVYRCMWLLQRFPKWLKRLISECLGLIVILFLAEIINNDTLV